MRPSDTVLMCEKCGNNKRFRTTKTYFHKTILDAKGQVEESNPYADLEGEELEITCARCDAPVQISDPAPFYQKIETLLDEINQKRCSIMKGISASREIGLDTGEDIGVAACAITDAIEEIRHEMDRHDLCPKPR